MFKAHLIHIVPMAEGFLEEEESMISLRRSMVDHPRENTSRNTLNAPLFSISSFNLFSALGICPMYVG